MKHCLKLVSVLSTGTLIGCSQLSLAPTLGQPATVSDAGAPAAPRVQPIERVSNPVSEVDGLFILGRAAHGAGQLALAEQRYEQVLNKQPSHLGALNSIAVIYAQTGRIELAVETFKRTLALYPQASYVHNNYGYILLQDGQLGQAERELKLAQEQSPSSWQTQQNLLLLAQAKAGAGAKGEPHADSVAAPVESAGPQLVRVGPQVYELRDGVATSSAPSPAAAPAGLQSQAPRSAPAQSQAPVAAQVPVSVSAKAPMPVSAQPVPVTGALSPPVAPERVINSSLRGLRIEVSNGVGIRHLAKRTGQRLAPMGIVTARLTNQPRFQQKITEIQFGSGQKDAADALSAKLPVAVRIVAAVGLRHDTQMRLVLGHDLTGQAVAAWLESGADEPADVALLGDAGWRWS